MDVEKCEKCERFTTKLATDGRRYPACLATDTHKIVWYVTEKECKFEKYESGRKRY